MAAKNKSWFAEGLLKEGFFSLFFQGILWLAGIGFPFVLAGVTALVGYLQGLPVAYVIAATTIVFAMTTTGVLRIGEIKRRRTPENKVLYQHATVVFDYEREPTTGKVTGVKGGQHVLVFLSRAEFDVSYVVDDLESSIDGTINTEAKPIRAGTIPPSSALEYRPDPIDLGGRPPQPRIEGRAKIAIRYGKSGKEKFTLYRHVNIVSVWDEKAGLYSQHQAFDVPEAI